MSLIWFVHAYFDRRHSRSAVRPVPERWGGGEIEKVGGIGAGWIAQVRHSDADEAESASIGFFRQQGAGMTPNCIRHLCGIGQAAAASESLKARRLQFQYNALTRSAFFLASGGDRFAQGP